MEKETLDKINSFTRRDFKEDELYTFPVTLCDNDVDRDGECFSDKALETMSELFIGKTGIFDHDPKGENQSARIYDTEVVADSEKTTAYGAPYKYLKAMAYMARTDNNKSLIQEIDAGIKKEVSVSCTASEKKCSICGCNRATDVCGHEKGREYDGQICYDVLDGITDAYEWSFVAVPAQINAGVTKKFEKKEEKKMNNEFTPITSQEDLDRIVAEAVEEATKQYEGWISPEDHQKEIDAIAAEKKNAEIKCLKLNAAIESGLPVELAEKISGEDEESIKKDAEIFAQLTAGSHQARHFSSEGGVMSGVEKEFYKKNPNLKK